MIIKKLSENKFMMRLEKGEEIIESIKNFAKEYNVKSGEIKALGAVNFVSVSLYTPENKSYITKEYSEPFEITNLYGNISSINNEPYLHIHITLANKDFNCVGGHLNKAIISATFEGYIETFDAEINRVKDENINLNVWDI